MVELAIEKIEFPEGCNIIFGQSHFIRTPEHLFLALTESMPGIKFGLAFAEASTKCLVRSEGTDAELKKIAEKELAKLNAGHTFLIILRNAFPINVLNAVKNTAEVATVFCASGNPVQVVLAKTPSGNGVLGVIDGLANKGIEGPADVEERREMLKRFGYKP